VQINKVTQEIALFSLPHGNRPETPVTDISANKSKNLLLRVKQEADLWIVLKRFIQLVQSMM